MPWIANDKQHRAYVSTPLKRMLGAVFGEITHLNVRRLPTLR
jgi:hypothetical protein